VNIPEAHRRNQARVNAKMAEAGMCLQHQEMVDWPGTPALYLVELRIGNVIPLCASCCEQWKQLDEDDPQIVSISEITQLNT
jgi:hypothetical protein